VTSHFTSFFLNVTTSKFLEYFGGFLVGWWTIYASFVPFTSPMHSIFPEQFLKI
jgi:hypothetical protein